MIFRALTIGTVLALVAAVITRSVAQAVQGAFTDYLKRHRQE